MIRDRKVRLIATILTGNEIVRFEIGRIVQQFSGFVIFRACRGVLVLEIVGAAIWHDFNVVDRDIAGISFASYTLYNNLKILVDRPEQLHVLQPHVPVIAAPLEERLRPVERPRFVHRFHVYPERPDGASVHVIEKFEADRRRRAVVDRRDESRRVVFVLRRRFEVHVVTVVSSAFGVIEARPGTRDAARRRIAHSQPIEIVVQVVRPAAQIGRFEVAAQLRLRVRRYTRRFLRAPRDAVTIDGLLSP